MTVLKKIDILVLVPVIVLAVHVSKILKNRGPRTSYNLSAIKILKPFVLGRPRLGSRSRPRLIPSPGSPRLADSCFRRLFEQMTLYLPIPPIFHVRINKVSDECMNSVVVRRFVF